MLDMINRSHKDPKGKNRRKPWKWMLVDSAIVAGITALATLPGAVPNIEHAYIAAKAFGMTFLFELAVERGLKKKNT